MMLIKATLMAALLGAALGDQHQYTHYDPVQQHFGVRQSGEIDPTVISLGLVSRHIFGKFSHPALSAVNVSCFDISK